ncbi:hypothetical protein LWI28_028814 [Acer negundo]|uniref:Uncharacterized protein n=1 Tax=Acer negundo TaxID=4023 RepID=A0AAD5JKR6_ACENE|nr:hypothetical protein LWI28_028814 [Acer negundo]
MWDKVGRVGLSFGPPNQVEHLKVVGLEEWNHFKEPKSIISNVGPMGGAQSDVKVVDQSIRVDESNLGKNQKKWVGKHKLQFMGNEYRVVESYSGKISFESSQGGNDGNAALRKKNRSTESILAVKWDNSEEVRAKAKLNSIRDHLPKSSSMNPKEDALTKGHNQSSESCEEVSTAPITFPTTMNVNPLNKNCKILDWMGSGEIVDEGRWSSSEPNALVHHVPIGPNAMRVWVDRDSMDFFTDYQGLSYETHGNSFNTNWWTNQDSFSSYQSNTIDDERKNFMEKHFREIESIQASQQETMELLQSAQQAYEKKMRNHLVFSQPDQSLESVYPNQGRTRSRVDAFVQVYENDAETKDEPPKTQERSTKLEEKLALLQERLAETFQEKEELERKLQLVMKELEENEDLGKVKVEELEMQNKKLTLEANMLK